MDWQFILLTLKSFGFSSKFIGWIHTILKSGKLSVLINGTPHGYFSCSKGVRQGDILSPIIFCLAEEVLNRGLSALSAAGHIKHISSPRCFNAPTHLLYFDDLMVFCRGDLSSFNNLSSFLEEYAASSGQIISSTKSLVYFGKGALSNKMSILQTLGLKEGHSTLHYLSLTIFRGHTKSNTCSHMLTKLYPN